MTAKHYYQAGFKIYWRKDKDDKLWEAICDEAASWQSEKQKDAGLAPPIQDAIRTLLRTALKQKGYEV